MTIKAQRSVEGEPFRAAREELEKMLGWLMSDQAPLEHSELEEEIGERGREVMRLAYQEHLDQLAARERKEAGPPPEGVKVRVRSRQLESMFGRVVVRRLGYKSQGARVRFPLDERLNLPADLYSHPVRQRIAREAQRGPWQQAKETVQDAMGAHVPKRQAEQITVRAAQDFNSYYANRSAPANDVVSKSVIEVLSCDSTGITMRPESLRESTRKQAQAEAQDSVRGDPMKDKGPRKRDKRMAVVTAVWEQEPKVRTAEQIVNNLRRDRSRKKDTSSAMPRPQNKQVCATVEQDQTNAITKMFEEARRRDPAGTRTAIVLVDGERRQIDAIEKQARTVGMMVIIVLDIIHVLHYLWLAGMAMCRNNEHKAEHWVATYLYKVLTRPAIDVVAGIRQAATMRGLKGKRRRPIEKCAKYLLNNSRHIRYSEFLAKGFPIASGVIEGACRHLVHDRMDITGARWNLTAAEAVLRLRALRTSGDWDDYWSYHVRRESERNYQSAA